MKILQVHNLTRFRGGGDRVFELTVEGLRAHPEVELHTFIRDSAKLAGGFSGRWTAARNGMRSPREVVAQFAKSLEETTPDVVHVHELYPYVTPWVLPVCREAGVPVVMSCHEFRLTCPVGTHLRSGQACRLCLEPASPWACARLNCRGSRAESMAFALRAHAARRHRLYRENVTGYLAASHFMKTHFEKAGYAPVYHIPFPIVVGRTEDPKDRDGGYAAYAGRFVPEKGIHTLLSAAERSGVPLRLAGRVGGFAMTLPPRAECVGELRGEELDAFYREARFLVVPSEWDEPYGLVAGEAQLHGRPVIATRVGGLQELVADGETGRLVAPGDPEELAAAMSELWADPERARTMGQLGRERIAATCSLRTHTEALVALYREMAHA